jgi:hypothetical protein
MFRLVWSHAEAVQDSTKQKRATAYLILLKNDIKFRYKYYIRKLQL